MNSEELEISLKAEFEGYLNDLYSEMRQRTAEFQRNFEAEFEKHKAQMDEAIRLLTERFEQAPKLEPAIAQSITEHLRLAKDAGAELAATAFDEAEKLVSGSAVSVKYDVLRDAIAEISSKTSQSTILTSLISHAREFAPRGVFFIVKHGAFVPWKRFDSSSTQVVPVGDGRFESSDSVLDRAVNELKIAEASYFDGCLEEGFLGPLGLGRPDRMYALPLIARGRGVAVLYVDYGDGTTVNLEALETLVRVAGLTVELLAASSVVNDRQPVAENTRPEITSYAVQEAVSPVANEFPAEVPEYSGSIEHVEPDAEIHYTAEVVNEAVVGEASEWTMPAEPIGEPIEDSETGFSFTTSHPEAEAPEEVAYEFVPETAEETSFEISKPEPEFEETAGSVSNLGSASEPHTDFAFSSNSDFGASAEDVVGSTDGVAEEQAFDSAEVAQNGYQTEGSPAVSETIQAERPTGRLSSRNLDLPIAVSEDERPLHTKARRFARLLVEEIKLYNQQKVEEGRNSSNLYDQLREAIDRSREMYDKRVEPMVASKFDYFDYELVNNLAQGEAEKLGPNYHAVAV
ncbi:hypothetical protein [Leptolyngbya sp. 7M]|uniref:hypothetical protein n=1 Tax=Leptolyngbya sp. 7M TaxID=2812896 RepID=UPI001B8D439F|nr:hypothetical protein [Leptolyngbya sp. 7M]QYO66379.1 hypothetical protein JVX88_06150 [Leptolyngbya sp. 7M]